MSKIIHIWEIFKNGEFIGTTESLQVAEVAMNEGCEVILVS